MAAKRSLLSFSARAPLLHLHLTQVVSPAPAAENSTIKLEKSSSAGKVVKKKKKSGRVGFDRGADAGETPQIPVEVEVEGEVEAIPAPPIATPPRSPPPVPPKEEPNAIEDAVEEETSEAPAESEGDGEETEERQEEAVSPVEEKAPPPGEEEENQNQDEEGNEEPAAPVNSAETWKAGTFMDESHASVVNGEFSILRALVEKCIRHLRDLSQRKRENQERSRAEKEAGHQLESEYKALEKMQEELAEAEDFEGAHEASMEAQEVQTKMRRVDDLLLQLTEESEAMDARIAQVRADVVAQLVKSRPVLAEVQDRIQQGFEATLSVAEDAHADLGHKQEDTEKTINELEDVLQEKEKGLQEREETVMDKVKEDAGEIFTQRDSLLARKPGLAAEIAELEAALAAKKGEMREVDCELEECSIETAKEKYSEEFAAVEGQALWLDESVSMDAECTKSRSTIKPYG